MTNKERRLNNLLFIADEDSWKEMNKARNLLYKLNNLNPSDYLEIRKIVNELFGKSDETTFLNPPFYCDYGSNIEVGKNCFINYNCTFLDNSKIILGNNVFLAPNVSIYTAGHPLHPDIRNTGYEYGIDVNIGNNVWIGGNSVICPGVTIGNNVVIGAGSVVTKNIPDWSLAAGNPCKVIRQITEEDKEYYFKNRKIDEETLKEINNKINME